jgi:hypothetical protein
VRDEETERRRDGETKDQQPGMELEYAGTDAASPLSPYPGSDRRNSVGVRPAICLNRREK